jgi:hypothetical protein
MNGKTVRIQQLNDEFRRCLIGGVAVITPGVAALGPTAVERIVKKVQVFNQFSEANDPYGEHDVGLVDIEGETLLWKIDYYDKKMQMHSPDPADPTVTQRVMTILLASEY